MPAEPDVRMRSLDRPGQQPKVLHVKIATSVGDFLLGPQASDQRDRFLGAAGRLRTVDRKDALLARVLHAEAERGYQAPLRELVDRRELLREQHRISSREHHHTGAELEPTRAPRYRCERCDRPESATACALRKPDRVPAERFARIDDRPEARAVEPGARRRAETEA